MEIRVLRYFLEAAREGSMTRAAERLHVTQPTLSKQIKELENELGKQLFHRGSTSISLTEEGMILRKRAEDLLAIADKIENEFRSLDEITGGIVSIGCAESKLIKYLARAVKNLNVTYPQIQFRITSGDTSQVAEKLENGVLDLAFIVEPPDLSRYNYIEIPEEDIWGVYMPQDCPLAEKSSVTIEDLLPYPVMCSEQALRADIPRWGGELTEKLNVVANFNLANNGLVFVREGVGIALGFEGLVETTDNTTLTFRPLEPQLTTKMYGIWKKYQVFTPVACLLAKEVRKVMGYPVD
ncbi:LysR family transcriptional regulator [Lachnospira pectinoschiza]|uniref:DNA-binding transcriptional regulator, LysR family n=1 Tax=Lachnospira pectinoschiza TaxID=28052 RepID=A0A1G9TMX2_9FIRM|nr:LysR family transcriptional regulator [Lachnospira pectinoschiza]SDM49031.1 DNA-binding transcriptional regulator, LysR family [Lachnospira pectinoschiza]